MHAHLIQIKRCILYLFLVPNRVLVVFFKYSLRDFNMPYSSVVYFASIKFRVVLWLTHCQN